MFFCALQTRSKNSYNNNSVRSESSGNSSNLNTSSSGKALDSIESSSSDDADFDLDQDYNDDDTKTDEEREVLKGMRGKRKALKERKVLAVSSVDGIIDFWKQILVVSGLTPSTSERALQTYVSEHHDFDPYSFKRRTIATLMRYLPAMWGHEEVSSLPPSTVRNLLDLMHVALKSLQDSKLFPLQSAVSERDRLRASNEATAISSIFSNSSSSASADVAGNPGASTADSLFRRSAAARSAGFRVSEGTVAVLADMGFRQEDVRRMAASQRTNSVSALTTHLLEMQPGESSSASSSSSVLPDTSASSAESAATSLAATDATYAAAIAAATAAIAAATAVAAATTATATADFFNVSTICDVAAFMRGDEATRRAILAAFLTSRDVNEQSTTDVSAARTYTGEDSVTQPALSDATIASAPLSLAPHPSPPVSSDPLTPLSPLNALVITTTKPLPFIPRRPTEDLQKDKSVLQTILQKVFRTVPVACLRLIERGVVNAGVEWGIDVASVNQVRYHVNFSVVHFTAILSVCIHDYTK